MSNTNLFEVATRGKFRFPFKGMITTEDLWDLSLTNLDNIFKTLNSQAKQAKEESLLDTKSKEDEVLEKKIEIIKHIVSVKLAEKEAREKAFLNKEKRQKLMEIKAKRDEAALESISDEELNKMLSELEE